MDSFTICMLSAAGCVVLALLYGLVQAFLPRGLTVNGSTERTAAGHTKVVAGIAVTLFLVFGGAAGAVIGGIEVWKHLSWIPATFSTIGIVSVVLAVALYLFGDL